MQPIHARLLEPVAGHDVAGEGIAIDEEDFVALVREQHRGGRTSAAGSDYDCVVQGEGNDSTR